MNKATIIMLAVVMLPALSQAQTVSICDRTPQVRDAIGARDCATVDSEQLARISHLDFIGDEITSLQAGDFAGLTGLTVLDLRGNRLVELPEGVFAGLTSLQHLRLDYNRLAELPEGVFAGLTSLQRLGLRRNLLAALPEGVFAGLTSLQRLRLDYNLLAALPEGVFAGLTSLQHLRLDYNLLAALPEGVFAGLTGLRDLVLEHNLLAALPEGVFAGLTSLEELRLFNNLLAELPEGVFAGLTSLEVLYLNNNRLADLPEGLFDDLTTLHTLVLSNNFLVGLTRDHPLFAGLRNLSSSRLGLDGQRDPEILAAVSVCHRTPQVRDAIVRVLKRDHCSTVDYSDLLASITALSLYGKQVTALKAGDFNGLAGLQILDLGNNRLAELRGDAFSGLTGLQELYLGNNLLAELPGGAFSGLAGLQILDLRDNHLVGLTRNDPLFAGLPNGVYVGLSGQVEAPEQQATQVAAAAPVMLSASDTMGQGFVRIINESEEAGSVRILAFDDGGNTAEPIEVQLGANKVLHFNSNDLENGNANKGIYVRVGSALQGDWRLGVETTLPVRVLAFVRTNDGFLTAMHDRLPRDADGRLAAHTFNPGSNSNQVSRLRLVNTGANAESLSIEGVDDQGAAAGPVTLTLAAGESRSLSALDLEDGAQGLTGTLGDGAGKWRLFIDAWQSVVGMSLLESASGHLTNISTGGVVNAERLAAAVPLMLSASDTMRQGFVRIINESEEAGSVRVLAFDDGGNAANPIEVQLDANKALHFNSDDLENGNASKGIVGVGSPVQGDWRLAVDTALDVRVLAFVRTNDGFLTAMHDRLPRDADGRLAAHTFNPGSNSNQVSKLRLVNTGANAESVSIEGVDDQGNGAGPVTLTLAAGESRTLSALELEEGAQGLIGTLGDGAGKWSLFISAGQPVVGMSLLEAASGHLTNLSTTGFVTKDQ